MKVVIVNTGYPPEAEAGPAFSVQNLAEQLVVDGHQVDVICLSKRADMVSEVIQGVQVHRIASEINRKDQADNISRILERSEPDVVHTNWLQGFVLPELTLRIKATGTVHVHTAREYVFLCKFGTMFVDTSGPCKSICKGCHELSLEKTGFADGVDVLVGVSQFCLDIHLRAKVFRHLRHSAVVRNSFVGPSSPLQSVKVADNSRLELGYLGRIQPSKGIHWFLQQLGESKLAHRINLSIAGKVPPGLEAEVESRYPNLNISWLGFVAPVELISRIDWLIVPSLWYEPSSRAVLEAYSFGVPVLGAKMGGIPEIIQHGHNGRLFSPQEKTGVVTELQWLLTHRDQWSAYRKAAWQSRVDFSRQQIANDYVAAYNS